MIPLPPRPKVEDSETVILKRAMVAVNRLPDVRCSRNNNGRSPKPCGGCFPKLCQRCAARLKYPILFGLGDGSPDLVGIITLRGVTVLPLAFGLELKRPGGEAAKHQELWHRQARAKGMLVAVVTSDVEAVKAVEVFRAEYTNRLRHYS